MRSNKIFLSSVIIVSLFFNSITVLADQSADDLQIIKDQLAARISTQALASCQTSLVPAFDIELQQFFQFMNTNFKNKSSTSSLSNLAIARFRDFKRNLNNLFARLSPAAGEDAVTANTKYILCLSVKDTYIETAKKMLIDEVKKTTAQKQTAILVEKYQAINSQLRNLNESVAQLYGYFMTFEQKLPGFLQQCTTK